MSYKSHIEIAGKRYEAIFYKGKPLGKTPKTYKSFTLAYHGIGDIMNPNEFKYNSSLLYLFTAPSTPPNMLKYGIYRDGSFYPFYGNVEILGTTTEELKKLKLSKFNPDI